MLYKHITSDRTEFAMFFLILSMPEGFRERSRGYTTTNSGEILQLFLNGEFERYRVGD